MASLRLATALLALESMPFTMKSISAPSMFPRILFCPSISSAYSCPEGLRPTLIIISFRGMTIRNPL